MMISPEGFISEYIDKSYRELLPVRDRLIREIRHYEKHNDDIADYIMSPSPEVVYSCNLLYLAKLCDLIAKKFNQEDEWNDNAE
jgi:hypothetical protein